MEGFRAKVRVVVAVIISMLIGLTGLWGLLKPISNGCVMTYMYPTYIPISKPENVSSAKYGLYLYHEGWKPIDFDDHVKNLNGVPVLFIPGNGGSYKQVRSLGAESDRAYQGGPLEQNFDQYLPNLEGVDVDLTSISLPRQYKSMLDWFAVDLEGEHSAMDSQILQEHAEYVVYSINRILDQYKESQDARAQEGDELSGSLPRSVILVGHSMGGFVARAAVVHPHLRKFSVETVLTLSTPHQSPPVAFQPSLGHYYSRINEEWRKGYEVQTSRSGNYMANPLLSHVVVVSISGGYNDYQVRTKLESLDGIVPSTHGFMMSSTAMKNVWLSMEHQVILWCNQLVVQVSHTLLSLVEIKTGKPFHHFEKRLAVFKKMLHSGIPQNLMSSRHLQLPQKSILLTDQNGDFNSVAESRVLASSDCPRNIKWSEDGFERDLFIQASTVTVLAMDGRRRWLDIRKLGSNIKSHFVFVTNLSPCSGVRLHLWPEKGTATSKLSGSKRVLEVTLKMVHIPSRPAPMQVEPGSQIEQAPPSAVFLLGPHDLRGFRFLTISVAPRQTVSGRPPPATSMGVGQFFDPKEGDQVFSPYGLMHSLYWEKDMTLKEGHPLIFNLTFSVSLGLLPVLLSVRTTGCGIKKSEFPVLEPGDMDISRFCQLRCFPPVALSWDTASGLHIFPNLYSETVVVDSSPALWTSSQDSDKSAVLLLVDPHCSYNVAISGSATAAASRFLLLYFSQIGGLCIAALFFALMRQSHALELDQPIPSLLSALESNLRMPTPFFFFATLPVVLASLFSWLSSQSHPPAMSFTIVSILCYILANGTIIVLTVLSRMLFYGAGTAHFIGKKWWEALEGSLYFLFLQSLSCRCSNFASVKVVRIIRMNTFHTAALIAVLLTCCVHPAMGLFVLLLSHTLSCYFSLSGFLMASFRSHGQSKEFYESENEAKSGSMPCTSSREGDTNEDNNNNSPQSARSYTEKRIDIFHHQHGLLILHFLAALMFIPSFVSWLQRIGIFQNVPRFWDSLLVTGVIMHGVCDSKQKTNFLWFSLPGFPLLEIRLSFSYLLAGYFSYLSALASAPYRSFYAMAVIGAVSFISSIMPHRTRMNGNTYHSSRKHPHRH